MEDYTKACILTAYAPGTSHGVKVQGTPYAKGQKRLERSLIYHGFRHDLLMFQDFPRPNRFDTSCGYNIKASAFDAAVREGYTRILWLDSSVWAIRNPAPIFDYIEQNGWYFYNNGFDCGQTCDDNALKYFGVNREEAFNMPDCSSSMFGLHLSNPKAAKFLKRWLQSAKDGLWTSSRQHDNGSKHPRFLFDRQDQSCASVIINQEEMNMVQRNTYSAIAKDHDYSVPVEKIQEIIALVEKTQATETEKAAIIKELTGIEGYKKTVMFVMRGL